MPVPFVSGFQNSDHGVVTSRELAPWSAIQDGQQYERASLAATRPLQEYESLPPVLSALDNALLAL